MVFNDTTTKLGLIQDCEMLVFGNYGDITDNPNRLLDFTARLNRAQDKAGIIITSADGRWEWDDTNHTDLPIASTSLVSGQRDYTMDVDFLDILKVVILDSAGNKSEIYPYGIHERVGGLEAEDLPVTSGIPHSYRKTGSSFMLYPVPNYSVAAGLIVYYQRPPSYFISTDTTKAPGIPTTFHRYLSLEASLDYCLSKQITSKNDLAIRVKEMADYMEDHFSKRARDESKFIRGVRRISR